MCTFLSFALFSCSDDDPKGGDNFQGNKLTPQENKAKMEQIGQELIGKINSSDHQELITTIDNFLLLADEGGLFEEEDEWTEADSYYGKETLRTIRRICSKTDLGKTIRFSDVGSELYRASDFYAIYTYKNGEWLKTSSDKTLEFHFTSNKQAAIIKISCSGKETQINIEEDKLLIPEQAKLTITVSEKELCKLTVDNSIDLNAKKTSANVELSASGYIFKANAVVNAKVLTCSFNLSKGNETLISADTQVTATKNYTEEVENLEEIENPEEMLSAAVANLSILGQINAKVSCSDIQAMCKELDANDIQSESHQSGNENEAKIINKYSKGELRYSGSDDLIATVEMQAFSESENYGDYHDEYWYTEPVLIFAVDDSRYSFENYFDEVTFGDLINSAENLYKQYEKLFD